MTEAANLARLSAAATQGEWELQDGCSWRRIGTTGRNGNVICPDTYSRDDRHPDLTAGKGEDIYANLRFVVALVNAYRSGRLVLLPSVEDLARVLCQSGGFDPDETMPNDGPRWRYYAEMATALHNHLKGTGDA